MDGLWAITDIIRRSGHHNPTVRRLVVPGHEYDEKRKREEQQRQMKKLQTMMLMRHIPTREEILHRRRSMPSFAFWQY